MNGGKASAATAFTVLDKRNEIKPSLVSAEAAQINGAWSVTLSRKLHAPAPYQDLSSGKNFTIGLAVHLGHAARRFHYVSLERTLVIDQGDGDFVAVGQ